MNNIGIYRDIRPNWPYCYINDQVEVATSTYEIDLDKTPLTPPKLEQKLNSCVLIRTTGKSFPTIIELDYDGRLYVVETVWAGSEWNDFDSWEHLKFHYRDKAAPQDPGLLDDRARDKWLAIATKHGSHSHAELAARDIARRASYKNLNEDDYKIIGKVFHSLAASGQAFNYFEPESKPTRKTRPVDMATSIFDRAKELCKNGYEGTPVSLKGSRKAKSAYEIVANEFCVSGRSARRYYSLGRKLDLEFLEAIDSLE